MTLLGFSVVIERPVQQRISDVWVFHGRQGGENDKLSFMILERGPWAFFQGAKRFLRSYFIDLSPVKEFAAVTSARITERAAVLDDLRDRLATLTGQVK